MDKDKLVEALTDARKAFLLALPADGSWKRTEGDIRGIERVHGPNSLRGFFGQSGLVEGYYREEVRHRLTDEGLYVAAALRSHAPK